VSVYAVVTPIVPAPPMTATFMCVDTVTRY
jgi:hypothetical protein